MYIDTYLRALWWGVRLLSSPFTPPRSPGSQFLRSVLLRPSWRHPHPCLSSLKWKPGYFLLSGVASHGQSGFLPLPHACWALPVPYTLYWSSTASWILTWSPTPGRKAKTITHILFRVIRTMIQVHILKLNLRSKNAGHQPRRTQETRYFW